MEKKPGAVAVTIEDAGLGLAIVRKILDLHGSRITVSSQVEKGTCFQFDLPTKAAA